MINCQENSTNKIKYILIRKEFLKLKHNNFKEKVKPKQFSITLFYKINETIPVLVTKG